MTTLKSKYSKPQEFGKRILYVGNKLVLLADVTTPQCWSSRSLDIHLLTDTVTCRASCILRNAVSSSQDTPVVTLFVNSCWEHIFLGTPPTPALPQNCSRAGPTHFCTACSHCLPRDPCGSLTSKGQFGWALLAWLQPTPPETIPTGAHQLQGLGRAVL